MSDGAAVIVLQHAAAETAGALLPILESAGLTPRTVHVYAGHAVPREIRDARALVVLGGPMGVYEADAYPHLLHELRLIEHALRDDVPVLGICLGSELLAAALGAAVRPSGRQEIGWYRVDFTPDAARDALFGGIASRPLVALHWHGDVFDLPRGAVPLARSAMTKCQAFAFGTSAYGILFHLEVTPPIIDAMIGAESESPHVDAVAIRAGVPAHERALRGAASDVFGRWVRDVVRARAPVA